MAAAWAVSIAQAQNEEQTGRIVAQRLADGRTEFGWQPAGAARILPRARYFPADAQVDRWLNSSPVEVDGEAIGRINARLLDDGRIEFAFTPTDGERIAPPARYFPANARANRWLRSTGITISAAPAAGFVAISASGGHACAIRAGSGAIECWGDNYAGQIDAPAGRFTAVNAARGNGYTCGLRESGEIECWGAENSRGGWKVDFGQLDPPPGSFTAVGGGGEHACGLRTNGAIECWGTPLNEYGQADAPAGSFRSVSAGAYYNCAIRAGSGEIECWGDVENRYLPADEPYVGSVITVRELCGLLESGETNCATGESQPPPGPFSTVAVSALNGHACAIRTGSGAIECWGDNRAYRWNDETQRGEEFYGGQLDAPPGRFTAVAVGESFSCAIRDTGAIECWGWSEYGATVPPTP